MDRNHKADKAICSYCSSTYATKFNLRRHQLICQKNPSNILKHLEKRKQKEKGKEEKKTNQQCKFCSKFITRTFNLRLHEARCCKRNYGKYVDHDLLEQQENITRSKKCNFCKKQFSNRTKCLSHMKHCQIGGVRNIEKTFNYRCLSCNRTFMTRNLKQRHYKECVGSGLDELQASNLKFNVVKGSTFKDSVFQYHIEPLDSDINHMTNLSLWKMVLSLKPIIEHFQNRRKKYPSIKIHVVLSSEFLPPTNLNSDLADDNQVENSSQIYLQAKHPYECYPGTDIRTDILIPIYKDLIKVCDDFEHFGSGWRLKTYTRLTANINVANPLRVAACEANEHMLPLNLAKKHALLQVEYEKGMIDNDCFKWAVYATIYAMFNVCHEAAIQVNTLKSFVQNNRIWIDFSMFKEWPTSVWYDRSHPEMHVFNKFEDVNHLSINIYTVDGQYVDKKETIKKKTHRDRDNEYPTGSSHSNKTNEVTKIQERKNNNRRKTCIFLDEECEDDQGVSSSSEHEGHDFYEVDSEAENEEANDPSFYRMCDNLFFHPQPNTEELDTELNDTSFQNNDHDQSRKKVYGKDCEDLQKKSRKLTQKIEPIRVTHNVRKFHLDLLVVENQYRNDDHQHHFVAVKDFNRLISGNNGTNGKHHYCKRCFQRIRIHSKNESNPSDCERFKDHTRLCNEFKVQRLELPCITEDIIEFKSFRCQQMCPFIMVADMETIQVENKNILNVDKRTGIVREDEDGNELFTDGLETSSTEEEDANISDDSLNEDLSDNEMKAALNNAPSMNDFYRNYNRTKEINTRNIKSYVHSTHKAISVCAKVIGPLDFDQDFPQVLYVGEDAARRFIEYLKWISAYIKKKFILPDKEHNLSPQEQEYHNKCWTCHICGKHIHDIKPIYLFNNNVVNDELDEFDEEYQSNENVDFWRCVQCDEQFFEKPSMEEQKVIEHSHVTASYRGPAHQRCDINYKIVKESWKLPIFFHNGGRFDNHLILTALTQTDKNVTVLPRNMESFISFTYGDCEVKDSLQFLPASLDELASTLQIQDKRYPRGSARWIS